MMKQRSVSVRQTKSSVKYAKAVKACGFPRLNRNNIYGKADL
jgi:hypothetical protein